MARLAALAAFVVLLALGSYALLHVCQPPPLETYPGQNKDMVRRARRGLESLERRKPRSDWDAGDRENYETFTRIVQESEP